MSSLARARRASPAEIGRELGAYRVDEPIGGEEGSAVVYRARRRATGREVALKVFDAGLVHDRVARERFVDTVRRQKRIRHPSVVRVEGWNVDPLPYVAMTAVRGPSLRMAIEDEPRDDGRALAALAAAAEGLEAGLRRGLAYRQLQPAGILLPGDDADEDDRPPAAVLGDFGAARPLHNLPAIESGRLGPFSDYIAPEEIDDAEPGAASLVYNLAAIAYECLTGRRVFAAPDEVTTLRGHLEATPRRVGATRRDLPRALDEVLDRALAKSPEERHFSPRAFIAELDQAYPPEERGRPAAGGRRPRGPAVPAPRAAAVALALVAVAAGAGVGIATAGSDPAPEPREPHRLALPGGAMAYPADWTVGRSATPVPGLTLERPVSLMPPAPAPRGAELVVGRTAAAASEQRGAPVDLADGRARRVTLPVPGPARSAEVYLLPAAGGRLAAACLGPPSDPFLRRCRHAVSTLRATAPGPALHVADAAYAAGLARVVRRIESVRSSGRGQLARARTRPGQGRVAGRLGGDYGVLARALARVHAPAAARGAQRSALFQLRRASRGYRDMARAAGNEAPGSWTKARNGVRSAEGRFNAALRRLRRLGYRVG